MMRIEISVWMYYFDCVTQVVGITSSEYENKKISDFTRRYFRPTIISLNDIHTTDYSYNLINVYIENKIPQILCFPARYLHYFKYLLP